MAAHRIVGLVAVAALAGCGSVESPPAPAGGQAVASTPVPAPAPGWSSAPGTGEKLYVNVGHDGDGRVVTRVAIADRDGGTRSIRLVRGSWAAPQVVAGRPEGMSWDGSRVVLQSTDDPGRFVAVRTSEPRAAPQIVAPARRSVYDGLSVDGRWLFVTQIADPGGGPAYRIYRYDLDAQRLDPTPIIDKLEGDEAMVGTPVARAVAPDFLYTVYADGNRPFVHALESQGNFSLCRDLPAARAGSGAAWTAQRRGASAVVIANSVLRTAYRLQAGNLRRIAYAEAQG